ncbi:serine/threonine-protein kinase [Nocardiopsis alba]|uniref:serine/threonine-protein kinase n=1 Tax=Nocardiopsis alba TaxID=53437 RepID=UPI0033B7603A
MAPTAPFSHDRLPPGVDPPRRGDPERFGDYRVVGRIGAGGMGAVYAGVTDVGRAAAVKVVHSQFAADPDFRARFAREVALVSRVRATCAPAFLGADTEAAVPWMATEYVPGLTLRQHVKRNGPLTGGMLTAFAVGLAEALTAIHAAGVVHRDLKPGNVILAPDGPKVLDFGIARAADGTVLTATGGLHGTPGWVSPEQYEGADATGYSDMFAWGGLVALAATGRDPFGKGAVDGVIHRSRYEEPDLDGVPEHLMSLVRRSLSKGPDERPRADEALTELTRGWSATRVMPARTPPLDGEGGPGQDARLTEIVPELLSTEWTEVSDPGTRRVRGPRRVLLLSAGAAVLVVALIGGLLVVDRVGGEGSSLTDGLPWGEGTEGTVDGGGDANGSGEGSGTAEEGAPLVQSSPEEGTAVVTEAIELMEGAPGLLYRSDSHADQEQGHPAASVVEYSREPVRVFQKRTYDLAGIGLNLRYGDDLENQVFGLVPLAQLESAENPDYYRQEGNPAGEWDPMEELGWGLAWILEPDAEIEYQGRSRVPHEQEFVDGGVSRWLEGFEETDGHHYSGTVVQRTGLEHSDGESMSFDLWIDDEGYPLRFAGSTLWVPDNPDHPDVAITEFRDFDFGEAREIYVPEEPEILPERPSPGF